MYISTQVKPKLKWKGGGLYSQIVFSAFDSFNCHKIVSLDKGAICQGAGKIPLKSKTNFAIGLIYFCFSVLVNR